MRHIKVGDLVFRRLRHGGSLQRETVVDRRRPGLVMDIYIDEPTRSSSVPVNQLKVAFGGTGKGKWFYEFELELAT